jgi:hypothetical protein
MAPLSPVSETATILDRIADGRTDLVFDFVAAGHPAWGFMERDLLGRPHTR